MGLRGSPAHVADGASHLKFILEAATQACQSGLLPPLSRDRAMGLRRYPSQLADRPLQQKLSHLPVGRPSVKPYR